MRAGNSHRKTGFQCPTKKLNTCLFMRQEPGGSCSWSLSFVRKAVGSAPCLEDFDHMLLVNPGLIHDSIHVILRGDRIKGVEQLCYRDVRCVKCLKRKEETIPAILSVLAVVGIKKFAWGINPDIPDAASWLFRSSLLRQLQSWAVVSDISTWFVFRVGRKNWWFAWECYVSLR